ncbi:hypothetical protein ACTVZO_22525 [Streptomyces sp. IBSNAI002]|uniref:hypothetical protein n=1 Tax=Streptomyces sp. IBSNAI002 TaxID=3457500 RepID=UPI003FD0193E
MDIMVAMEASQVVQALTAGIGVAGTLAAALLTQAFNRRTERDRHKREDQARWLADRQRVGAKFLAGALSMERELWSTCAQLDREMRSERLPGHTSILLTPDDGIPGVLDATTRAIVVETIEEGFERLNELEELVAELTLIGSPEEAATAGELLERLGDCIGHLEVFAPFDDAADAVERCRSARDAFSIEARRSLQGDESFLPPDRRPRA